MSGRSLFKILASLAVLVIFLCLSGGIGFAEETILKVTATTARIREKPDIGSPVIATSPQSTLLAAQGKEGRWYKVEVLAKGGVLSGYIHESVVSVVMSKEEPPAEAPAPAPPKKAAVKQPPVKAEVKAKEKEAKEEAPLASEMATERPAGQNAVVIRPYLRVGFLLTPPSADDLGYEIVDDVVDLDQFLDVNKGNFGAGVQIFLPLSKNPSLKWGLDIGAQKLFSSRFETDASDLPYVDEDYHLDSEYDIYLLAIAELTPAGSPFFVQGGAGGHFVKWSYEYNYESDYQSKHETGGGMEFCFGLMGAAGTSLRINDRISLPISLRLDGLLRYGLLVSAGLVVGFSF